MRLISYKQKNFDALLEKLYQRPSYPPEIENAVKLILADVQLNGNTAIKRYALEFDKADLSTRRFAVSEEEIKKAGKQVDKECKAAIKAALRNISAFAKRKIPKPWSFSPRPGVIVGERYEPFSRVGVYIPGGSAPLVSTVVHTAGIAKAAGVEEIVAITPPGPGGTVHPAILYALNKAGATEIYRLGGVYGIAALAYGTKTIDKVEKIVGPGNAYVTAAKKLVYGDVAIDMVAGPSEIMVIADADGNPDFIAADMLSQIEHGSGLEQAVLVTTSIELVDKVKLALKRQAKKLKRGKTIQKVMKNGVYFIEVKDFEQAANVASNYAPEHLEIMCRQAGNVAKNVKAAGAIFIGRWTPEPVGDFMAGPSHVLPTGGSAKYFSGLTVESFFRRMSILNYLRPALKNELPMIEKFAEMEGLDAHGNSAKVRFDEEA